MLPLSSCYMKISVVSQCWILAAVQYMNIRLFAFLFQLTTCSLAPGGLLSDLVAVDAD